MVIVVLVGALDYKLFDFSIRLLARTLICQAHVVPYWQRGYCLRAHTLKPVRCRWALIFGQVIPNISRARKLVRLLDG